MNWEAEAADMTGLSRDFLNNKRERERVGDDDEGGDILPGPGPLRSVGGQETTRVVERRLGGPEVKESRVTPPAGVRSLLQEQFPDVLLTVEVDNTDPRHQILPHHRAKLSEPSQPRPVESVPGVGTSGPVQVGRPYQDQVHRYNLIREQRTTHQSGGMMWDQVLY